MLGKYHQPVAANGRSQKHRVIYRQYLTPKIPRKQLGTHPTAKGIHPSRIVILNHHVSPPFGRICWYFFHPHRFESQIQVWNMDALEKITGLVRWSCLNGRRHEMNMSGVS